jgi:hypothetical protein
LNCKLNGKGSGSAVAFVRVIVCIALDVAGSIVMALCVILTLEVTSPVTLTVCAVERL